MNHSFSILQTITIFLCLFFLQTVKAIEKNQSPNAVITQVWAYGVIVSDSAVLDYKQNNLRFFYDCPNNNPELIIYYQYRLVGFKDRWSSPTIDKWTFFTDIDPGNYIFQVRCRYDDEPWGPIASHPFIIDCPWWLTWWAYLIFFIIIGGTIAYILYLIRLKINLYNQLKLERQIKQFRTQYVIQTSREIRTPLTIIRNIIDKQKGSQNVYLTRSDIKHLRTSSRLLMQMMENLLEFREMDKEKAQVDITDVNEIADAPINQQAVLIVEQNELLAEVIRRDLMRFFKVEVVYNGNFLMEKMHEIMPAAVVLDTDLDGANAYELLHEIKNNSQFAFIPTIIISDFDNNRSIIRAIRSEADDYLQKPFNCEVLTVMIIKKMKNMLPLITEKIETKTEEDFVINILEKHSDKLFIEQLDSKISENISNPDFDVKMLADVLMISRGQLYKKVKALKSVTPSEYLRDNRLSKAADLIKESQYTIQQIMHQVGMPDATNFYLRFKEKYGMSPSVYRDK